MPAATSPQPPRAWSAAKANAAAWLEAAWHALKHDRGAAQRLAAELSTRAGAATGSGASPKSLQAAATYFTHNVERMNYSTAQAMAMAIGSGDTEAACKTLVKARFCSSGMQWTREGAQSVLTLRALLLSPSRWTSLWKHFDQHGIQKITNINSAAHPFGAPTLFQLPFDGVPVAYDSEFVHDDVVSGTVNGKEFSEVELCRHPIG